MSAVLCAPEFRWSDAALFANETGAIDGKRTLNTVAALLPEVLAEPSLICL